MLAKLIADSLRQSAMLTVVACLTALSSTRLELDVGKGSLQRILSRILVHRVNGADRCPSNLQC